MGGHVGDDGWEGVVDDDMRGAEYGVGEGMDDDGDDIDGLINDDLTMSGM
jgi:hypothetical protein